MHRPARVPGSGGGWSGAASPRHASSHPQSPSTWQPQPRAVYQPPSHLAAQPAPTRARAQPVQHDPFAAQNHGHALSSKVAHESYQIQQLEDECDSCQQSAYQLQNEVDRLNHELRLSRDRERNPTLMNDYAALQEEVGGIRRERAELEREYNSLYASYTSEKKLWDSTRSSSDVQLDQLARALEAEKRNCEDKVGSMRSQHAREIETLRRDLEGSIEAERKRVSDLEAERARHQAAQTEIEARHRAELADSESRRMAAEADLKSKANEIERKEELRGLFEQESKTKQERVEESLKMAATVQGQLRDAEATVAALKSDLTVNQGRVDELEKSLAAGEKIIAEEREAKAALQSAYDKAGAAVGATGVQVRGQKIADQGAKLAEDLRAAQHEAVVKQRQIDDLEHQLVQKGLTIETAEREKADAQDTLAAREGDLSKTREELLTVTVELRSMIDRDIGHARETDTMASVIKQLEDTVAGRDETIERLNKEHEKQLDREAEAAASWLEERTRLERDFGRVQEELVRGHRDELQAVEKRLALAESGRSELERNSEDDRKFAQLGLDLCRLLSVDSGRSPAAVGNDLYRTVEGLVIECKELQRQNGDLQQAALTQTAWVKDMERSVEASGGDPGFGGRRAIEAPPPTRSGGGGGGGNGGGEDTAMMQWYKDELRRSEERHARSKQNAEAFARDVADALQFTHTAGTKMDGELLVARIKKLVRDPKTPLQKKLDDTIKRSIKGGKHGDKHGGKSDHKSAKLIETLQKKFRVALETIESLEELVEYLKAMAQSGGGGGGDLEGENAALQSEVLRLKEQLYADNHALVDADKYYTFYRSVNRALSGRAGRSADMIVREIRSLLERYRN